MLRKNLLRQLVTEYVEEYSILRGFSNTTLENKRDLFLRFTTFLAEKPLTLENVQLYVAAMRKRGVSANSIRTEISNIKAFVRWLIKKKKIEMEDWTTEIEIPKVHLAPEMLPDSFQAEKIIELGTEPGPNDHILHRKRKALMRFAMRFALRTGVRSIELRHIRGKDLQISDEDPQSSKVYLVAAKGGTPQWQPLPVDMLEELKQHVQDDLVFPVCEGTCNEALKRGAKLLGTSTGINMHLHILRKVFGTTLARYFPMAMVCQFMRHTDISITQKFYINYGLMELGHTLNERHPLIRLSSAPQDVIHNFIQYTAEPYFSHDKRIQITTEQNAGKKEVVMRLTY